MSVTEPNINIHGEEEHEAFGLASVGRAMVGGTGCVLFDSDLKHHEVVVVRVKTAVRKRDYHRDWLHSHSKLLEFQMSMAQWASFVSSMNGGEVPCTLTWTQAEGAVDGIPYQPRLHDSMNEAVASAEAAFQRIQEAMAAVDALDNLDPKPSARERREAMKQLRLAIQHTEPNIKFATESLNRHVEEVVNRGKADMEAFATRQFEYLGEIGGSPPPMPELLSGE